MKIAILGTRGIPNNYGGFEEFAENLALQLVEKNHDVSVYCPYSHQYKYSTYKNINLIKIKSVESLGGFSQLIYDYKCLSDASKKNFDAVIMCGYSSSIFYFIFKNKFKLLITNLDGIEWKRSKWNFLIKKYLQFAEKIAVNKSHVSVADNPEIQAYYENKYKIRPNYIPYGANIFNSPDDSILHNFNLTQLSYIIVISRLEPENSIQQIIESYNNSGIKKKLVIISNYSANNFGKSIYSTYKSNSQIIFLGDIYDKTILNNLRYYSYTYIHGHTVGGTNPSLLEAMACNCKIIAHDNNYNKSILGKDALYFRNSNHLTQLLLSNNFNNINTNNNIVKINERYNWKRICEEYESVFKN